MALVARPSHLLRGVGFLLIVSALVVSILFRGSALGAVAWFGHISLASALVFLALLIRRRRPAG